MISALMLLVGWQERNLARKIIEWWDAGMVMCLGQGADLHMPHGPADATATHYLLIQ